MMFHSEDISLSPYIQIPDEAGASFGGSQTWFPSDGTRHDRLLQKSGCGLIAAVDFLLYVGKEEVPASREAYLKLLRSFRRRYPVFPAAGSFNVQLPLFLNRELRRIGFEKRLRFSPFPTKRSLLKRIRSSLAEGYPVILLIPPKCLPFTRKKGVVFHTMKNGVPVPVTEPVRSHFITVTGIHYPILAELPVFYEISSWGKRYYINSEEFSEYMRGACLPCSGSFFYLK